MITPLTDKIIRSVISPTWDDYTQSMYFTSLEAYGQESTIYRYNYRDGVLYSAYIDGLSAPPIEGVVRSISFILPATAKCKDCNDLFIVGDGSQVSIIKWDGISIRAVVVGAVVSIEANVPSTRLGQVGISPNGRLFGGTILFPTLCNASTTFSCYRYDKPRDLVRLFGSLQTTTGIAFNPNTRKMYHLDTCQLLLTEFDLDSEENICN